MRGVFKRLLAAALLAGGMASASATVSYSGITIFGDSLSDTGNIFLATGGRRRRRRTSRGASPTARTGSTCCPAAWALRPFRR